MNGSGFYQLILPSEQSLFEKLTNAVDFEITGKGRLGNHLVKENNGIIPLVRTTTRFQNRAGLFCNIHLQIIKKINAFILSENLEVPEQDFNNALAEVYDSSYTKMGYHSDQALDLEDYSFIALFSCYENPDMLQESQKRKMIIKNKMTGEESEIVLHNDSVILFSLETNKKFQHKIISDLKQNSKDLIETRWHGITFRTSKTFIHFEDNQPYFQTGELLTLADEEREKEFFQLRGQENRSPDFIYPDVFYTISPADLLIPGNKNTL
ncbi:alpha-ketoglutarate-dependent dioxygenase AlkB [uncultured Chryseobacterium sp.]|uniref:alpha-ketoglutarate-dependent dioxygenase AlkB n=1 Tax=uncultured Chryseobacterium sp. TaxID=259322 RepID=UPI0025DF5DE9|nr:alpha-ketoglutarate-dependent dioxygenase AlkB [uncultured Chryseobacterium sp.]